MGFLIGGKPTKMSIEHDVTSIISLSAVCQVCQHPPNPFLLTSVIPLPLLISCPLVPSKLHVASIVFLLQNYRTYT